MPGGANIAKGGHSSFSSHHNSNITNPAPIAKGLIFFTATLIAAGYAIYENRDQLRELVDRSRRKISVAMHSFADDLMPSEEEEEHRRRVAEFEEYRRGRGRSSTHQTYSSNVSGPSESGTTLHISEQQQHDDEKLAAAGTGRDLGMADSMVRYRSQHRIAGNEQDEYCDDNDATTPFDENKILFDASSSSSSVPAAAESQTFYDIHRTASGSEDTLSAHLLEKQEEPTLIQKPYETEAVVTDHKNVDHDTKPLVDGSTHEQVSTPLVTTGEYTQQIQQQQQQPPYWSIHEWNSNVDNEHDELTSEVHLNASSEPSLIGSDVEEDDDERVEVVSDVDSSSDNASWSEVGSEFSGDEHR